MTGSLYPIFTLQCFFCFVFYGGHLQCIIAHGLKTLLLGLMQRPLGYTLQICHFLKSDILCVFSLLKMGVNSDFSTVKLQI